MLKKTITYTDYNDVQRTEDFYFNFTEAELTEMEFSEDGGFGETIKKLGELFKDIKANITPDENSRKLIATFKKVILLAYGEKSSDGKRFIKSEELSKAFSQTDAYNKLFMELATKESAAAQFVNGITPSIVSPVSTPAAASVLS